MAYLRAYARLSPFDTDLYYAWRAVTAAGFAQVCLPEEAPHFIRIVEQSLRWREDG